MLRRVFRILALLLPLLGAAAEANKADAHCWGPHCPRVWVRIGPPVYVVPPRYYYAPLPPPPPVVYAPPPVMYAPPQILELDPPAYGSRPRRHHQQELCWYGDQLLPCRW